MWGALAPHINFRIFNQTKNLIVMYKFAKPLPSVEILNELLKQDSSNPSGLKWKVNRRGPKTPGNSAGRPTAQGYYQTFINSVRYYNHRIIWKMVTGNDPEGVIDHIHGLEGGNVYSNFQDITQQQNMAKK